MKSVLFDEVLVLNKNYDAAGVCTVKRAIKLCYKQYANEEPYARVVDPESFLAIDWEVWTLDVPAEGEKYISASAGKRIRVPTIIRLSRFDKMPWRQSVNVTRRNLFKRDEGRCQYCGVKLTTTEVTVDHILPKCQGGKTTWENCVIACKKCNSKKADRTPEQARMKLLKHPVKPKFEPLSANLKVYSRFLK